MKKIVKDYSVSITLRIFGLLVFLSIGVMFLGSCNSDAPTAPTAQIYPRFAYVANYGDNNVSQYAIGSDGSLTPMTMPTVATGSGPAYVTVDPSGKYAYVANTGADDDDGTVSQYIIESDGSLTPMTMPTVGAGNTPDSITVDPSGKYAYVANTGSEEVDDGNVSQYIIGSDGSLTPMTMPTVAAGKGPDFVAIDPSGNYAYVTNLRSNNISQYTIGVGGALTPMTTATVVAGSVPWSIAIDPSGKYAYVANFGGGVSQYTIGVDGALSPMVTATVAAGVFPRWVTVDPSGKYAYVANAGDGTVSQYTIGTDGALAPMTTPTAPVGGSPWFVAVDPSGKYAYVANSGESTVSQFTIGDDGALTPMATATVAVGSSPLSIIIVGSH